MPTDALSSPYLAGTATWRPLLMGTRHMVAAGHHLAAQAAFEILEAGGNAFDAGAAAGIALGVVHTDIVNVAGVAPILVYLKERNEVLSVAGLGWWPRAITPDLFQKHHGGKIPPGLLRTVVPAAPDAWITVLQRFGTMSFGEVAAAAIRFAREGFAVFPLMAELIETHVEEYRRWPANAAIYLPGGKPPRTGDVLVQADLARTLQFMADQEKSASRHGRAAGLAAARDAFYRGDIARTIVDHHRANGGLLSAEDMAGYRSEVETPSRVRFHGIDVYACGAWCQGPVLGQALKLVEGIDLKGLGHNSPAYLHAIVETLKLVFADRERHYGDPRFVEVPLARLLSDEYAAERRAMIDPGRAFPELPPAGDAMGLSLPPASAGTPRPPLDTSYVCVVDRHGNVISATPSDTSSDMEVIPGTGLCPSSRGSQSWADPKHASSVAPGKRPRLTPNPALAIAPGRWVLPFGTPGGDVQIQAMLQVFLNMTVFGMDPQQAVEAPRVATYSFPDSFEPHSYYPGRLQIEGRLPRATGDALAALGHQVNWWPDLIWRAGAVCTIRADLQTGLLSGAADPRRAGYAVGW